MANGQNAHKNAVQGRSISRLLLLMLFIGILPISFAYAAEEMKQVTLDELINEAMKNSPEVNASEAKTAGLQFRVPQAKSLPDPMFMFGYQNEGFRRYTYGESPDAQWMYSLSQMFPYPGKRPLRAEMAAKEAESARADASELRLRTIEKIKELYYSLLFAHKNLDILKDRTALFTRIEDAALSRYSAGKGSQQDVLMAQTEKYIILEQEAMVKQKIQSIEAMMNAAIGRDITTPLGRPVLAGPTPLTQSMEEFLKVHVLHSPFIASKEKMIESAEARIKLAKKEYYPDFTVAGSFFDRKNMQDMWSLTTTINIPLFYKSKQRNAVNEANANLSAARQDLEAAKNMLASVIRDNYTMVKSAEKRMDLYKGGLIPKNYQSFEQALSGYVTGKTDALTVISTLKSFLTLELSYWEQFMEREKAVARLHAIADQTLQTIPPAQGDKRK